MSKIKFAVVGLGHIGKRHAEMITRNSQAELVALCDIRPKEILNIDSFIAPFFSSIEEMLGSDLEFDVLNVCTPNGLHYSQSKLALENQKHVVCEKPLALSKSESDTIVELTLANKKQVFCVMQNRYSPPSKWLKQIVEEKLLGDIFMVQLNCYWNRDERYYKKGGWKGTVNLDGGTLFTQFSHFIDIMYWLFGDIENIKGNFKDYLHQNSTDFEDSGIVLFDFVKGGMGSVNYSTATWDKNLESSITIVGEKGSVKVGGQYMNEVEYCHVKGYEMPTLPPSNPSNDYKDYKGSAANHNFAIENVIETLNGKATATATVFEGMKVVDIIERIYKIRDEQGY